VRQQVPFELFALSPLSAPPSEVSRPLALLHASAQNGCTSSGAAPDVICIHMSRSISSGMRKSGSE